MEKKQPTTIAELRKVLELQLEDVQEEMREDENTKHPDVRGFYGGVTTQIRATLELIKFNPEEVLKEGILNNNNN